MGSKTDNLIIKLTTDGSGQVKAELAGVSSGMGGIESNTKGVNKQLVSLKSLVGAIGFAAMTKGLISANVEYQKLKASLKTVTGSQAAANREWARLEDFSTKTPFQIQEVVRSFVKLKALGLDPSTAALKSYGNTASAMGFDLNKMIEAVADASTGEFERLKEFGIKARQQGDDVSFTFQGVTTTVNKNAKDIEGYLRRIGDEKFGDAMDEQMKTLGGAFSNLGVASFNLSTAIGDAGVSDLVEELTIGVTDLTKAISKFINDPSSMPDWLKVTAFTAKALVNEFSDLGDLIGAISAIAVKAVSLDFDAIDAIIAERQINRDKMEADMVAFVARLEQIGQIKNKALGGGTTQEDKGPGAGGKKDEQANVFTGLTEQEMQDQFDIIEAQFNDLDQLYRDKAAAQVAIEQQAQTMVMNARMGAFQQGVSLLQAFAGKSKTAAIAAIALQKGLAIAEAVMNTNVASTRALAELGPVAGPPAAASIEAWGAVKVGLIAATGLVQAGNVGGGGAGGAALGTPANPVSTTDNFSSGAPQDFSTEQNNKQLQIVFNGYNSEEMVEKVKQAVDDFDFILINEGSRQYAELTE